MKRLHYIEVRFLSATNTKPARIRIKSLYNKSRVVIPYNYAACGTGVQAVAYLEKLGFKIDGYGYTSPDTEILASTTFKPVK